MATLEELPPTRLDDPDPAPEFRSLEDAGPVLDVLASETARSILMALTREPATPTDLANRTETSIQNMSYHLSNLEEAELVSVVGTRYSPKGREMKVYAPTLSALVIGGSTTPESFDSENPST